MIVSVFFQYYNSFFDFRWLNKPSPYSFQLGREKIIYYLPYRMGITLGCLVDGPIDSVSTSFISVQVGRVSVPTRKV